VSTDLGIPRTSRPVGVLRAVQAALRHADSRSVEHASEFERALVAELAGSAFRVPPTEPVVLDARPNPAIRFAMWGGGVPPVNFSARVSRPAPARGVSPWATNGPMPPFSFDADRMVFPPAARTPAGASADVASDVRPAASAPRPEPPPVAGRPRAHRVQRRLSAAERTSLDVMRRSGAAALRDDFTDEELKAAYRQLAFRFHPDQHPGAAAAALVELGRTFSLVHAAYRSLATR
jgi:hypothetical protein